MAKSKSCILIMFVLINYNQFWPECLYYHCMPSCTFRSIHSPGKLPTGLHIANGSFDLRCESVTYFDYTFLIHTVTLNVPVL